MAGGSPKEYTTIEGLEGPVNELEHLDQPSVLDHLGHLKKKDHD